MHDATDIVGVNPLLVMDVLTGLSAARGESFASTDRVKTLSHNYIIRRSISVTSDLFGGVSGDPTPIEMDFIDGYTEFLGLEYMNNESTSAIDADVNGVVAFRLAAGSNYYPQLGIVFSDTTVFDTMVGSIESVVDTIGNWYVASDGTVYVNVGVDETLPEGISLQYSYKDPNFDQANRFSVDYVNGLFYTSQDMVDGAEIKYKAGSYLIAYDIAAEFPSFTYDSTANTMQFPTTNLARNNELAKVIWAKAPDSSTSLASLQKFFSPIVYSLGFRFQ